MRHQFSVRWVLCTSATVAFAMGLFLAFGLAAASHQPAGPPSAADLARLKSSGAPLVAAITAYRVVHGEWPEDLSDTGLVAPETSYGAWEYSRYDVLVLPYHAPVAGG